MKIRGWWRLIKLIKRLIFRDNPNMFNLWSAFEEISKDIITYGHGVYYETEGEKQMNKEQKIQELSRKIDELKQELEELQDKPYGISYPNDGQRVWSFDCCLGSLSNSIFDIEDRVNKHSYKTGLLFDIYEEAKQFIREQTLIKKIKCWAKEQQGDWKPDWSDKNQRKYSVDVDHFNKETICDWYWGHDKLPKLPYFKTEEIAQACIDEFGDEILEVFC